METASDTKTEASPDQESWVKARIGTAIRMALHVAAESTVRADDLIKESAIAGIVNGASIEVIRHLDMEPIGVNLNLEICTPTSVTS